MAEKLTERARKVMALANYEAQRFNQEYIGTEHVLLGLIKEGSGVGATALKNCDVNLHKLRLELELKLTPAKDITEGIDVGKLPQTPKVRSLIDNAMKYAQKINCNYIGTEHLLYGLIADKDTFSSQTLMKFGLNEDKLTKEIEELLRVHDNLDSLRKLGLKAQNYWMIPRGNIGVAQFLQLSGREVSAERDGKNKIIIESKGGLIGRLNPPGYTSGTVIYDTRDVNQLEEALGLRDAFDINHIKYTEEPPASEVAKELKEVARLREEGVKHYYGLADRLEKRV